MLRKMNLSGHFFVVEIRHFVTKSNKNADYLGGEVSYLINHFY